MQGAEGTLAWAQLVVGRGSSPATGAYDVLGRAEQSFPADYV